MLRLISVMLLMTGCGCTHSVTLVQTCGTAADVVDETTRNAPSTSVSVPVSAT